MCICVSVYVYMRICVYVLKPFWLKPSWLEGYVCALVVATVCVFYYLLKDWCVVHRPLQHCDDWPSGYICWKRPYVQRHPKLSSPLISQMFWVRDQAIFHFHVPLRHQLHHLHLSLHSHLEYSLCIVRCPYRAFHLCLSPFWRIYLSLPPHQSGVFLRETIGSCWREVALCGPRVRRGDRGVYLHDRGREIRLKLIRISMLLMSRHMRIRTRQSIFAFRELPLLQRIQSCRSVRNRSSTTGCPQAN